MQTTTNLGLKKPEGTDVVNIDDFNYNADIIDTQIKGLSDNKVDKATGKQLSTEDYTTSEKNKLAGIATGANNYSHPSGDGNLHVPATSTTNNGNVLKAGATAGSLSWSTLSKGDVGLGSVDNTADSAKNVLSATKLATARTISLTGDVTGSVSFNGSANVSITATVADDSHTHNGTYYTETEVGSTTSGSSGASKVGVSAISGLTGSNVQDCLQNLFQYANDGKTAVANAITAKGVSASSADTFPTLATKVGQIKTGYVSGDTVPVGNIKQLISVEQLVNSTTVYVSGTTIDYVTVDDSDNFYASEYFHGSGSNKVSKYNPSGQLILSIPTGVDIYAYSIAVDKYGNIHMGLNDNTVRKYNSSGTLLWTYSGHTNWIRHIAVDKDGNVYSSSRDKTVKKLDSSGNLLWTFTGHLNEVWSVAVDDLGHVYSGSNDKTVKKINPSGTLVWTYTGHTNRIDYITTDDLGYVYTASQDKTTKKLTNSGSLVWSYTDTYNLSTVCVDRIGNVYVAGSGYYVKKLNSLGQNLWTSANAGVIYGVDVDSLGNVYASTRIYSGVFKISYDPSLSNILQGYYIK